MKQFNLSRWAIEHRALMKFFMAVVAIAGISAYFTLGQKEDPEFTIKTMVVKVLWPGASAAQVEEQVTDRIEKKLQETPGLDFLRSYSKPGEAVVYVNLKQSYPASLVAFSWDRVRKDVNDTRGTLPQEILGPYFNDKFGETFGSIYAFTGPGFSHAELKSEVTRIRQELLRVPMVSKVEMLGVQDEKIFVEFSTQKLAVMGLSPLSITETLQAQNAMASAGTLRTTQGLDLPLRVSGDFQSVESIRELGIRANGQNIRIGDIAEVKRGTVDPAVFTMRFGGQDAIGLALSMTSDGNVITLGKALDAEMKRLKATLPVGIEVHQVSDQPKVVGASVNEFMRTLIEAVVIVLAVSFLSLGVRTGLVVALSIPLVLAATFLAMRYLGIDLQRISLGALIIALGLLVDDAMIAVEMMATKLEEGASRFEAATHAFKVTALPMLTGTLITMAGFMPIALAKSASGEYTLSMFLVVSAALLISWVVAVTFTPYLGVLLLKEHSPNSLPASHAHRFQDRFRRVVELCLDHRKKVVMATGAAMALALAGFTLVPQQFFPGSNRPEVMVDLWLREGSAIEATSEAVRLMEKSLLGSEGVVNVTSYTGGGSPRFYLPLNPELSHANFAQLVVMTAGGNAREAVMRRAQETLDRELPQVRGRVSTLENGPPVGYPLQIRLSGPDSKALRSISADLMALVRAHPSARGVNSDWNEAIQTVRLDVDQDKARVLGVSSQQLSRALLAVHSGVTVTQYRERDELIDVVARARLSERNVLGALKDLSIPTSTGRFVPVSQVATLSQGFEDGIIWRRNRYPSMTIRADLAPGAQGPDVSKSLGPELAKLRAKLPDGYRIEIAGAAADSAEASASIFAGLPLTLFAIATLLMLQLQSFSRTALVAATAPLGLIGVTLALLISGKPFGFVALLGVISLAGMIMRNSLILVDQIESNMAAGAAPREAIVDATVHRFRPIMLTAAAAILAMIPLASSVFWGPMAIAIMGGLLVATLLTLIVLPALYAVMFGVTKPRAAIPATPGPDAFGPEAARTV